MRYAPKFKAGDRVVCVERGSGVELDEEYVVERAGHGGPTNLLHLKGRVSGNLEDRFELVRAEVEQPNLTHSLLDFQEARAAMLACGQLASGYDHFMRGKLGAQGFVDRLLAARIAPEALELTNGA